MCDAKLRNFWMDFITKETETTITGLREVLRRYDRAFLTLPVVCVRIRGYKMLVFWKITILI